ncbi:MAG: MCE family protein [Aquificae bacterium]|nr:MCE family protein [Aquificota bacterium]
MGRSVEFKLGLFVVAVSLAFAFLVITFGEIPLFKEKTKDYLVYFDDVAGLSKGAEVRVSGVRAGEVKEITLEEGKVKVVFSVYEKIKLYRDAEASIGTLGLMGDKYLAVKPGSPSAGELPPGGVIRRVSVVSDTDRLVAELTKTAAEFGKVARNLKEILAENRESVRRTLYSLSVLTETLQELAVENKENLNRALDNLTALTETLRKDLPVLMANLNRLLRDVDAVVAENRKEVREIAYNLAVITEELRRELPSLVTNLEELSANLNAIVKGNREEIERSIAGFRQTTENLAVASRKLSLILARLERGEGTLGKLLTDEELYESVTKGVKSFSKVGEVVERTHLYIGMRGELYREGDSKGVLTVKLEPDDRKYYLLEVVGDSRGRVYREEYLDGRELVRKEFKPEFTLQYARNFKLKGRTLTLRGGLKESTGGVGADLHLGPGRYLFADLWDFGRKDRPQDDNLKPNLQVGIHWHLTKTFFVRFGGDDLLNDNLRGFFGGAGFLFRDDDLKYLLGGVGVPLP